MAVHATAFAREEGGLAPVVIFRGQELIRSSVALQTIGVRVRVAHLDWRMKRTRIVLIKINDAAGLSLKSTRQPRAGMTHITLVAGDVPVFVMDSGKA